MTVELRFRTSLIITIATIVRVVFFSGFGQKFHTGKEKYGLYFPIGNLKKVMIPQPVWATVFGLNETSCVAGLAATDFGNFQVV
ncbi:MAG: hypothetical protein FWC50_04430 [Planctomycetaceae bacterium]|nr:hypothetical protein [Planctomycetaceae bacterium]